MDYKQIVRDFAQRTKILINEYKGDYEVTLLVNCCLGLLVVPKEKDFKKIPVEVIPEKDTLWGLSRESVSVKSKECGYVLREVIKQIRNGICHFDITSIPDENNQIEFLVIKDRGGFEAKLSVAQLKELAISLTDHVYKP